jgi:hypothetical protein
MQYGAVFVGQYDGTAERIEGFGHPRAHDSADIEHVADRHRAPKMRQQVSRSVMMPWRSCRPPEKQDILACASRRTP